MTVEGVGGQGEEEGKERERKEEEEEEDTNLMKVHHKSKTDKKRQQAFCPVRCELR